jgi:hypothetical protein
MPIRRREKKSANDPYKITKSLLLSSQLAQDWEKEQS